MGAAVHSSQILHLKLSDIEESDRVAAVREVFGRSWMNVDFAPMDENPDVDAKALILPGISMTTGPYTPHECTANFDRSNADDDLALTWVATSGNFHLKHLGREFDPGDGTAILVECAEPMVGINDAVASPTTIKFSRERLAPLVRDPDVLRGGTAIPSDNRQLAMLRSYLALGVSDLDLSDGAAAALFANHLFDVIALTLGANSDGQFLASNGGLKQARFAMITNWIGENLTDPSLSIGAASKRFNLSERTIQALFHDHETSFTDYVRRKRMALVHFWLSNPAFDFRTISELVYAAGFGDLSHFNRSFRSSYGASPSEIRHLRDQAEN